MKKFIISAIAQNQSQIVSLIKAGNVSNWSSLPYYRVSFSLFWSVFGPAAQYDYRMSKRYCGVNP
jgi:hypothetical protein